MKLSKIFIALTFILSMLSCSNDDNETPIVVNEKVLTQEYVMLTNIGETAGVQGNSYLQSIEEYDAVITNANAIENSNKGTIATYGNQLFFAGFFSTDIKKYTVGNDGSLTLEGELAIPTVADIVIVNETKGYILQNFFELKEFNPTTFEITSTISLQQFNTKRKDYPFSRAGELFLRPTDNKIFVALNYIENMTFQNIEESVVIAVIDGDTNTVEKLITDDRTFSPGMLIGSGGRGFSIDDNGDIYITCSAGYGFHAVQKKPAGILRIKAGTTEIDSQYFFNFSEAGIGNCVGLHCINNNEAYTFKRNLEYINDDFSNVTYSAAHNPIKINLSEQRLIAEVEGFTTTSFLNGIWMKPSKDGSKIYIPANNNTENGVYELNVSNNSATKLFSTTGSVVSFEPIN